VVVGEDDDGGIDMLPLIDGVVLYVIDGDVPVAALLSLLG
jgi:hypothetical protein